MAIKKLIEVALPLEKINAESAREKSIRHGHPSTLHLWWARRPLAAARAVIWSSLVDDPSSHPEEFPTEEAQNRERERLFGILEKLVVWENSNEPEILAQAKAEIMKSTNGNPPALLDPFAGGGSIPLEAQRLGLEAHAHDLNPVAVMINKAMIEIPPRFAGLPPVNPEARKLLGTDTVWKGAQGLADDVRYYGEWMKREAFKRIGHLYPKVKVPPEQGGGEATVIAWIWARTVKCTNPVCGCDMPLASSFVLSKKKGNEAWVEPVFENNQFSFTVKHGKYPKEAEIGSKFRNENGKGKKGAFRCLNCNTYVDASKYVDDEANAGRMHAVPVAVVAEGARGRLYITVDKAEINATMAAVENYYAAQNMDETVPHAECRGTFASNAQGGYYGFHEFKDYFTKRQLVALTTFSALVAEAQKQAEADAIAAGMKTDSDPLSEGGTGAKAYGQAVGVYLAFVIDKMTDYHSSICSWHSSKELIRNTFGRQAIPMVWDFAECNPFCSSSGSFDNMLDWVYKCISNFTDTSLAGKAAQFDAQVNCHLSNVIISTDPPYYDNIGYADLSDFLYVWLRQSLKNTFPELFRTMLVPKSDELIATPYRHDGNVERAKVFFEQGMLHTCKQLYQYAQSDIPVTIYYAYKQSDSENNEETASTGWETMLNAIIQSGFAITGTWPMRTEMANRSVASGSNALASSIVLVCRKRPAEAPVCTRRSLIAELKRELRPALDKLRRSNIAPVDLAQSAIGPGMAVFSKYRQVLESDGKPMSVRSALQVINQELDIYFNEQDGELDRDSRFCVELYSQLAFNDMKFGDADTLARAKNTSVAALSGAGVVYAQKGIVRLLTREELSETVSAAEACIWLLTQQLTRAMETGGVVKCGGLVAPIMGSSAERAKDLAYRLYTVAERRGWAQEAYVYNSLVIAWPEIQAKAAELSASAPAQMALPDM